MKQVQELVLDDITGEAGARQYTFGLDGVDYEIDLTDDKRKELETSLAEFVDNARRIRGGGASPRGRRTVHATRSIGRAPSTNGGSTDNDKIRAWAAQQGIQVASRGRLPGSVVTAFYAGHSEAPAEVAAEKPAKTAKATVASTEAKSDKRSKMPPLSEVADAWKQIGTYSGLGEALGVSYATARAYAGKAAEAGLITLK